MFKAINDLLYSIKLVWFSAPIYFLIKFLIKLLLGFAPVANVYVIERLFSSVISSINTDKYSEPLIYATSFAFLNFMIFFMNSSHSLIEKKVGFKFELYMKNRILLQSKAISYINYEKSSFQNQYSRIISSQYQILSSVNTLFSLLQSTISVVTVVLYLINININFIFIILIMVIPLIIMELKFSNKNFDLYLLMSEDRRKATYFESLLINKDKLKDVKLNMLEKFFINKWKEKFVKNSEKEIKLEITQMKSFLLIQIIVALSFLFSIYLVIDSLSIGVITVATLPAVIQAIQNLQGIVPMFAGNLSDIHSSNLGVRELRKFLSTYMPDQESVKLINKVNSISVNDLNFSYPDQVIPAIKNISFSINKGERVAIMGTNGSGKSTLIKCLTGLYDTSQSIKLNNMSYLEEINKESYWNDISVLFQDFNKYELTVLENIQLNNEKNLRKSSDLLKLVDLSKKVDNLDYGVHSILGNMFEEGNELSGGQWQKISIARSLFKEASFLFLDEPTSSLDPDSEFNIINNVLKKMNSKGILFITHRINVARLAEKIIYMEEGSIVEMGSHENLIKLNGKYAEMYFRQVDHLIDERSKVFNG
ncbi:ATP-binding cassette domain-containing protein [Exiguobacterium sp. S22-S28]|uniref:ATP-binding cassette domain-containing protein n=1 Tax=Exiguobacterium sp. S22-S28 TaxID=3342768 RepID=UPI00372D79FA